MLLTVFYAMHAHLSATVYLYLSAVFDSILCVCGLYELTMPSIPTVCNIVQRVRATLVIQYTHPYGPRLRGVHVLMKK